MAAVSTMVAIGAAAAAASTAYSIYSGEKNAKAQKSAQEQAMANAEKQAKAADEATNRANQKQPDTSAILSAAMQAGKGGQSGTMLTGPSGVQSSDLSLGKSTLLGS